MPAAKLFLSSADIAGITGMSLRSAQYMLNAFDKRGQAVRVQGKSRNKLVDIDLFTQYLCDQDGQDPKIRKRGILDYLHETGSRHTRKDIC